MSRVTTRNVATRASVQGRPPSLADELAPLWSEISKLRARQMSIFPATVTSVSPMRIRIDGEAQSLAASPDSLAAVQPGDRVRVLRYGTTHLLLDRIGGTGAMLLDQAAMSGAATPVLTVPTHLRSTIRKLTLEIIGGSVNASTNNVRVSVLLNGDTGANYRDNITSIGADGIRATSERGASSAPRTAYVGRYLGFATIDFMVSSYLTYWSGRGWQNGGGTDSGNFISGGRWDGDGLDLRTFTLDGVAEWVSGSRARLWGYR